MSTTRLAFLGFVSILALQFSSCTLEPYVITSEELYTRNFIKTFGLIDEKQDWNLAKEETVELIVGNKVNSLKIYTLVDEKFYLVAHLYDVEGRISVPIDIPENSDTLKIIADGKSFYGTVGELIDCSGTGSRAAVVNETAVSGIDGTPKVTVDYSDYYVFDESVIDYITTNVLPEEVNNLGKTGTIQNFSMTYKGDPLTFYPMFFNTAASHILGVCWFVDASTATDAEGNVKDGFAKIKVAEEEGNPIYSYIRKVPVYKNKVGAGLQYYDGNTKEYYDYNGAINQYNFSTYSFTVVNGSLTSEPTTYPYVVPEDKKESFKSMISDLASDANLTVGNDQILPTSVVNTINAWLSANTEGWEVQVEVDVNSSWKSSKYNYSNTDGTSATFNLILKKVETWHNYVNEDGTSVEQKNSLNSTLGITQMRSAPITIDFASVLPVGTKYYFYLDVFQDGTYNYSDSQYKHSVYSFNKLNFRTAADIASNAYPVNDVDKTSLAAYYETSMTIGEVTEDRTFFSFEDWNVGVADLNDIIFMVKTDYEDDDEYTPPVNNEDEPEDPGESEEETLKWLVAAEDLGDTDDFDFNDVIFQVQCVTTNKDAGGNPVPPFKKVVVQALAAGGTLQVYLHFNNGTTDYVLGPGGYKTLSQTPLNYEWHNWFNNGIYGSTTMINTGGTGTSAMSSCDISDIVPDDFTMAEYSTVEDGKIKGFYITVRGITGEAMNNVGGISKDDDEVEYKIGAAKMGEAPQMFVIPDIGYKASEGWYWPKERRHIMGTYTNFATWVTNKVDGAEWYKENPKSEDLVIRINPQQ